MIKRDKRRTVLLKGSFGFVILAVRLTLALIAVTF